VASPTAAETESPTAGLTLSPKPTTTPAAGSRFALTGSMAAVRTGHTATLLKDGRVLIAGGSPKAWNSPSLASAELYNPTTGKFTATGSMHVARANHAATLLKDGRVLITGGHDSSDTTIQHTPAPGRVWAPESAELYDPSTGKFTLTGSMTEAREDHTATLLGNGRVLVTGGWDCSAGISCDSLMTGEIYDPSAGTFSSIGPAPQGTLATLLKDGRVFLAADIEGCLVRLYDPVAGEFDYTAPGLSDDSACDTPGAAGHASGALTLLEDGRVLVTGGYMGTGPGTTLVAAADLFDPSTGLLSSTAPMARARDGHTSTLLPGGHVLVAGGGDPRYCRTHSCPSSGPSSVEVYDPATRRFTPAGPMKTGRYYHTATRLSDGRVLITGGWGGAASGAALASAELFA
jgi:hypothetical protein